MDLKKTLEQLSEEFGIPLVQEGCRTQMRGQGYYVQYAIFPDHPSLKPKIGYVSNKSNLGYDFNFGATEVTPLRITYTLRPQFITDRLAFFRATTSKLGPLFLAAFQGVEKEPLTIPFQAPTWSAPEEVDNIHSRTLTVPEDELLPFIREHVRFS